MYRKDSRESTEEKMQAMLVPDKKEGIVISLLNGSAE